MVKNVVRALRQGACIAGFVAAGQLALMAAVSADPVQLRFQPQRPTAAVNPIDFGANRYILTDEAFAQGVSEYLQGQPDRAVVQFGEAVRLDPQDGPAFNNRANARTALGDSQGALADYDRAVELDPGYAFIYFNRGITKSGLGDRQGALADYDQALKIDPLNVFAYNNRGILRYKLGDRTGSLTDFDRALRLDPTYAFAYHNRSIVRSQLGDSRGAESDSQKAAELMGKSPRRRSA